MEERWQTERGRNEGEQERERERAYCLCLTLHWVIDSETGGEQTDVVCLLAKASPNTVLCGMVCDWGSVTNTLLQTKGSVLTLTYRLRGFSANILQCSYSSGGLI